MPDRRRGQRKKYSPEHLYKLYVDAGFKLDAVAQQVELSISTVSRQLKAAGYELAKAGRRTGERVPTSSTERSRKHRKKKKQLEDSDPSD